MPIKDIIRINPLDLQGNIAIGISLPFNGKGVFNSTYSTNEQIKSNFINLLLTNKGERIMNPDFGADLKKVLFENITDDIDGLINDLIKINTSIYIPEIIITEININKDYKDENRIEINIKYRVKISGTSDQITVQFI